MLLKLCLLNKKYLISVIIVFILGLLFSFGFAKANVNTTLGELSLCDGIGNPLTELSGNENISAKITVYNNSLDKQTTTLVLALMDKNMKLMKTAISKIQISSGGNLPLQASMVMPTQTTNCFVKVMIWREGDNYLPLCEPMIFPQSGFLSNIPHSAVLLSQRWYLNEVAPAPSPTPGTDGTISRDYVMGNLSSYDVTKRFMATHTTWSYIQNADQIKKLINLGTKFEGTLSPTLYDVPNGTTFTKGRAEKFDGTKCRLPWMVTWNNPYQCCVNNPDAIITLKEHARLYIDNGADSLQFDDWAANESAYSVCDGCFCSFCMAKFKQYLMNKYTTTQLASFGVDDISTFHYKTYLTTKYGIHSNEDYTSKKTLSALHKHFGDFQMISTRNAHIEMRNYLATYTTKKITYSLNNYRVLEDFANISFNWGIDAFHRGTGETPITSMNMENLVTGSTFTRAIHLPQVVSPSSKDPKLINQTLPIAYAMGMHQYVPWHTWIYPETNRYFGRVSDFGLNYHFIRQYPELFDGYEIPAKVAILIKWDEIKGSASTPSADNIRLRELSMMLIRAGIPFKHLVVNYNSEGTRPNIVLNPADLQGVEYIIEHHSRDLLSEEDRNLIYRSRAKLITPEMADAAWQNTQSLCKVSGAQNVYPVLRAKPYAPHAPKIIHIINQNATDAENITLTVDCANLFQGENSKAYLYKPGDNPSELEILPGESGKGVIKIHSLPLWGIIKLVPDTDVTACNFQIPASWSGMNIGSPSAEGSAQYSNGEFKILSKGAGLNTSITLDGAKTDQFSYVYKQTNIDANQDFSISTRLVSLTGGATGSQAGLMIREYPYSNGEFISLSFVQGSGLKLTWRENDNTSAASTTFSSVSLPKYIKIQKTGNTYTAYQSEDGINWGGSLGNRTFAMTGSLWGIFASTTTGNGLVTGTMDHVSIAYGNAAMASPSPSPSITEYTKENFDLIAVGSVPIGWTKSGETYGSIGVVAVPSSTDKSLKIIDNDNVGTVSLSKVITKISGAMCVEFDYMNETQKASNMFYLYNGSVPAISLLASEKGEFEYVIGSTINTISAYTPGKWYHFKISLNTDTDKANVYIDNVWVLTDVDMRSPVDGINNIVLSTNGPGTGVVAYWNNLRLYSQYEFSFDPLKEMEVLPSAVLLPPGASANLILRAKAVSGNPIETGMLQISYVSSNPLVATVDSDGCILRKSLGTTTITAYASFNGMTFTDSVLVTCE